MTDLETYRALPESERDKLGFDQWRKMNQVITHSPGCFAWGEKHYLCAMAEIERLKGQKHD